MQLVSDRMSVGSISAAGPGRCPGRGPALGVLLAILMGLPGRASAGGAHGESFATLDRVEGRGLLETSLSLALPKSEAVDWGARLDLRAQSFNRHGLGGYVALPISHLAATRNDTALGNLELGGGYASGAVLYRASLVLNTSDDFGPANPLNAASRLTDWVQTTNGVTWMRLSVSPCLRHDRFYARFDGGIDIPIADEPGDTPAVARLNGGLGADLGPVTVTGELVVVRFLASGGWAQSLAVGAASRGGGWQPYGALVWPHGGPAEALRMAVVAGIRRAL